MSRLFDNLLIFGRVLRRAGIDVHRGRLLDLVQALGHVNLGTRDDVYHTCRALLVHRQEHIAIFDRAFAAFWREHHEREARRDPRRDESSARAVEIKGVLAPDEFKAPAGADESEGHTRTKGSLKTWSDLGALAVTRRHHRVEAFLFSTQLTRITRQLRVPRPDEALAAVSRSVPDWSGGTRIGGAVKEFHQRWSRRALHGGPVVLLVSDGWDCGDPSELADQIARLQRGCHRLVWLNPLIGTADYAPLTRGLRAALPFVDDFLPARTLTNLADLAGHLNALA